MDADEESTNEAWIKHEDRLMIMSSDSDKEGSPREFNERGSPFKGEGCGAGWVWGPN